MAQAQAAADLPMDRTVHVDRLIDAPRDLVWKAWTDPAMMARWWGPREFTNPVCKLNVKVGGALLIVMRAPDGAEHPMTGTFREVDPPSRLVFTNEARNNEGDVLLEGCTVATFTEDGGKTRLVIESRGVGVAPEAGFMLQGMEAGWNQSIDRLTELAAQIKERRHGPLLAACAAIALASAATTSGQAADAPPAMAPAPSGAYTLDKSHADLTFRVNHMGFSHYTARFGKFDATLQLDTAHPEKSSVTATIDPASLELNNPPSGFHAALTGGQWLDAAKFPQMTFKSTKVEPTGPDTAKITGDFSLHGFTHPVVLDAKFNGGYAGFSMDPHGRVGFSAHGGLKRSDFGIAFGIPAPGTTMGVSDEVEVWIEAEFTGPPLKK